MECQRSGAVVRILFVISNLIYGGAETQVIGLARELARQQHAVAIYTLNRDNPRATELESSDVELVADQKRFIIDFSVLWRLHRFIQDWRADIVHGFLYDGNLYARVAAFGTGRSALNSERNDNYRLNRNQRLGHLLTCRMAAGVVANSHAGAAFARKLFALPTTRVHVVWNGIEPATIDARIAANKVDYKHLFFGRQDVRVACLIGNIKPQKDYLLALETADLLSRDHPEWRVLFIGDRLNKTAGYKAEVLQLWQQRGLEDRALFAGLRTDVIEIISQCDVLFSTSLYEGFPNAVLEAMTTHTPAISTPYSDIQQILPNTWQVVSERSPGALVAAIIRAYQKRGNVRVAQRAWVERHATMAMAAQALLEVYALYTNARSKGRDVSSCREPTT